jgi:hypothetical protein
MITTHLVLIAAYALGAGGAGARHLPPPTAFSPGEQLDLAIDYRNVRSGAGQLIVGRPEGTIWPVVFQAKSAGLAALFDIREHAVTYWNAETRLPHGSDLNLIEPGDRYTDRARYDRENGKVTLEVLRGGVRRESRIDIPPDVVDVLSALLNLRNEPLAPAAHFAYPLFQGSRTSTISADVEGTEAVDTPAGRFDTWRVKVRTDFHGRFQADRAVYVWLSRDERHVPVRMTGDFAIGNLTATLTRYHPGGPIAASR